MKQGDLIEGFKAGQKEEAPPESGALAGLNQAQQYAVGLGKGPILVIAGAGTGKTRTLVHRVASLVEKGVQASSILLLTFTRRAAEEMLTRARELNPECAWVQGGTFHSVANRLIRNHAHLVGLTSSFTILDPADCQQMLKGAVDEMGLKPKGDKRFPKARTMAGLISKARNLELSLENTLEAHAPQLLPYADALTRAADAFAHDKMAQNLVDYDDLLFLAEKLLKENYEVRQELGERWQHILVDEYQDTNAVQARILELIASRHNNVMVVGDDAQSIYAFRGARVKNIFEFPRRFPGTRLVKLEQNYRSTQDILDLTNTVISRAAERYEKDLFTELGNGVKPALVRPREQRGQSRAVAEKIRQLLKEGARAEDIAVIFRAGRDSFDLENELRAEGMPFIKYGGIRFVELAHVKDVMAHLRVLVNPLDFLSWQRVLMLLPKVGPKTAQQIIAHMIEGEPGGYPARLADAPQAKRIKELADLAGLLEEVADEGLTPLEKLEAVLAYYEPICTLNFEDYPRRMKDLQELPAMAQASESLVDLLADTVLDPPDGDTGEMPKEPITLSTAHSAKGKEWPHVMVLWAVDGRFPAFPALDDPDTLEEERRLMYVACTRAGRSLTLFAPREHYFDSGGWRSAEVSRFLADIPEEMLERESQGPVFPVEAPSRGPSSRGSHRQDRPYAVGAKVSHASFGEGKVMGYKGNDKIIVHFGRFGLKILLLKLAKLEEV